MQTLMQAIAVLAAAVPVLSLSVGAAGCSGSVPSAAADGGSDATATADGADAGPAACETPADCIGASQPVGSTAFCCIDKACAYSNGVDILPCTDASAQIISASSYDQSCVTDSDCVAVAVGDFCHAGAENCPSVAISKSAQAQYLADVAKTNAAICGGVSSCTAETNPCCQSGKCQMGGPCFSGPASADAGAD